MQKLEIVPAPENFTLEKGNFIFKASTVITVEDTAMVSVAETVRLAVQCSCRLYSSSENNSESR